MGKILESIGLIEGFDISAIGKYTIKRDNLFEEIKKKDKNIQEEARDIINNSKGLVFVITKKKQIHGIYLFKEETKDEEKNLNLIKTVFTDEVSDEVKTKYETVLIKMAKEKVEYLQFDKVSLENDVIYKASKKKKAELISSFILGFLCGFMLGFVCFNDILMGFCFGIIFAPSFTGVDAAVRKKRGRKRNK